MAEEGGEEGDALIAPLGGTCFGDEIASPMEMCSSKDGSSSLNEENLLQQQRTALLAQEAVVTDDDSSAKNQFVGMEFESEEAVKLY